jgi:nicotinate phosphoribosyltransferase
MERLPDGRYRHPRLQPQLEDRPDRASLIDTDFYKLLMCQSVFRNRPDTQVTFSLINRTARSAWPADRRGRVARTARPCPLAALTRGESTWLRGNTFYGKRQMFRPDFMEWFENLRLPPYHLERGADQYELTFEGPWPEVMLWEIPALAVLMELRSRAVLKDMGRFELQVLYARAMTRSGKRSSACAARRAAHRRFRHAAAAFLPVAGLVRAGDDRGAGPGLHRHLELPHRLRRDLEAIGTNAHELPMVYAALAETDAELAEAPYRVLADWHEEHSGNLRIILPDTFGTEGFLPARPTG